MIVWLRMESSLGMKCAGFQEDVTNDTDTNNTDIYNDADTDNAPVADCV